MDGYIRCLYCGHSEIYISLYSSSDIRFFILLCRLMFCVVYVLSNTFVVCRNYSLWLHFIIFFCSPSSTLFYILFGYSYVSSYNTLFFLSLSLLFLLFSQKKIIYSYKVHTRQPRDRDSSIGLAGCCSAGKTRERTAWIVGSRSAMFSGETQENGLVEDAAEHNVNTDKKKLHAISDGKYRLSTLSTHTEYTHTHHTRSTFPTFYVYRSNLLYYFFSVARCVPCVRYEEHQICIARRKDSKKNKNNERTNQSK